MLSCTDNLFFDELGKDWFQLYHFADVPLEELYKRDWTFGGVVWNAPDIRFLNQDVIVEDSLKHSILQMHCDGSLMLKDREIGIFHHIAVKKSPAFVGRMFRGEYANEYVLTRCGYLPAGNGLVRAAVAAGHFAMGWSAFVWKLISGNVNARAQVSRWIRRRLGCTDWWR